MRKLSLGMKIGGGFGVVLFLIVIVSLFSWSGLNSVTSGFVTYKELAYETNLAGRIQANMLMVRMNVKDFIITGSEKDKKEYSMYLGKMHEFITTARQDIQQSERAGKIDLVTEKIATYEKAFEKIVVYRAERDQIVKEVLNITGREIEQNFTATMKWAKMNQKSEAALEAGMALRKLLLGRLYVVKFFDSNSPEDAERVKSEFAGMVEHATTLERLLNPIARERISKTLIAAKEYLASFEKLTTVIYNRNAIIAGTLDKIGPEVAAIIEDVKLSVKDEQDELGRMLQAKSERVIRMMLIVVALTLAVGIFLAFFITRSVTVPVRGVVSFVQQLATGDFTTTFRVKQRDEIGTMVDALNDMVSQLGSMIRDITNGVNTLSSSSTELASVSSQLATASTETAQKSDTVAVAAEEMSSNINSVSAAMEESSANTSMVASATEEMTATVGEIAKNTEKAHNISDEAVRKSKETTEKMNQLGESAEKIGKVTETITEISEQTNLLALNATIEAARAGEAGKGFAVVANEIKDLARQTAEATVDIRNQIEEMQHATEMTVADMGSISGIITDINDVISGIAVSVDEQSGATAEISSNIAQASMGIAEVNESVAQSSVVVNDITREIAEINQASTEVDDGSTQVQASAEELSKLSEQLNSMVVQFKV